MSNPVYISAHIVHVAYFIFILCLGKTLKKKILFLLKKSFQNENCHAVLNLHDFISSAHKR